MADGGGGGGREGGRGRNTKVQIEGQTEIDIFGKRGNTRRVNTHTETDRQTVTVRDSQKETTKLNSTCVKLSSKEKKKGGKERASTAKLRQRL